MKERMGASLIEAVISSLILSIITIPVISGLNQAYRNYEYSHNYYKAGLHAQSILSEVVYGIKPVNESLFSTEYDLDKFKYIVYICEIGDGTIEDYAVYSSHTFIAPLKNISFTDKSQITFDVISSGYLVIVDVYGTDDKLITRMLNPTEGM